VPLVQRLTSVADEVAAVSAWLKQLIAEGTSPSEIGIFVRSRTQLDRARAAVAGAAAATLELSDQDQAAAGRIAIGTMHLAKGLEFKAVAVMACDDDILPLQSRIEAVADEVELDDVYDTERHLFYVACTRARDRLLIACVKPGSEFLADLA
jgi:superfamily I DNA/RNA helicase